MTARRIALAITIGLAAAGLVLGPVLGATAYRMYRLDAGTAGVAGNVSVDLRETRAAKGGGTEYCYGTFTSDDGRVTRRNVEVPCAGGRAHLYADPPALCPGCADKVGYAGGRSGVVLLIPTGILLVVGLGGSALTARILLVARGDRTRPLPR